MALAVVCAAVCVLTAVALPVDAHAGAPTLDVSGAFATNDESAAIVGDDSANGSPTTVHADYALAGESWCASRGAEGTPVESAAQSIGSGNAIFSEVIFNLHGLRRASEYCVELIAENEDGTVRSAQVSFATPTPPSIEAETASHVTATDATLEATISPNGPEATTYEFFLEAPWCGFHHQYGACEASGGRLIYTGTLAAGSPKQVVSVDVASVWRALEPEVEYGYRVVATRGNATGSGGEEVFATPASESVAGANPTSTDTASGTHVVSGDSPQGDGNPGPVSGSAPLRSQAPVRPLVRGRRHRPSQCPPAGWAKSRRLRQRWLHRAIPARCARRRRPHRRR